jgi:hypothetical protein
VQRTGYFGRLFRRFATKNVLTVIVALLALGMIQIDSKAPAHQSAAIRQKPRLKQSVAAAHISTTTNLASPSINSADFLQKVQKEILAGFKVEGSNNFLPDARLEKSAAPNPGAQLVLAHKKLGATECSERWMDIQAGYGAACFDRADLEKIEPDWAEPGLLYLKASFSF